MMRKRMSLLAGAALFAAALAGPAPALADAIVVRSTGPSATAYPVGRRLPADGQVVLRAGDRVVLVGEGPTRTLVGAGRFGVRSAGTAAQSNTDVLRRFINSANTRINQIGASRGPSEMVAPPNVWVVDVNASGRLCVLDTTRLITWRSDTTDVLSLTVANEAAADQTATLDYQPGQSLRRWPQEMLPVGGDGTTFTFSSAGSAPRTLTLVPVGPLAADASPDDVVGILSANGCTRQIGLLGGMISE